MTTDRITPFLWEGEVTVRVIEKHGELWFVATDICRALGLSNPTEVVRGLDDDEKGLSSTETLGGHQQMVVVSESGLYALIFRSRKPDAVKFRRWVTGEVLPSIRRTGVYVSPGSVLLRKPYTEWSLEEARVALAKVNTAYKAFNKASAAWVWEHEGLPMPPANLLPGWWQGTLLG